MRGIPPTDQDLIRGLLDESGIASAPELEDTLLALREEGRRPAPAPSAELGVFMTPAVTPLAAHRVRRRSRGLVIGIAVAAAAGLGVSGAAATQNYGTGESAIERVLHFFNPTANDDVAPAPSATASPEVPSPEETRPATDAGKSPAAVVPSTSPADGTHPAADANDPGTPANEAAPGQSVKDAVPGHTGVLPSQAAPESVPGHLPRLPVPNVPAPSSLPGLGPAQAPRVPAPAVPLPSLPAVPAPQNSAPGQSGNAPGLVQKLQKLGQDGLPPAK